MGGTLLFNMAKFIARLLSTWVLGIVTISKFIAGLLGIVTISKFIARLPAHWRVMDGNY